MHDMAVESSARAAEQLQLKESRKEPGFWPTKENPEAMEWQDEINTEAGTGSGKPLGTYLSPILQAAC